MSAAFDDITIYNFTPEKLDKTRGKQDMLACRFVCDLYVQKMYRNKPPRCTRICISPSQLLKGQAHMYESIAGAYPAYNYDDFKKLNKKARYIYILDLIQQGVMLLADKFEWDKSVFERAYKEVLATGFKFAISYPPKLSRNRKTSAEISIEKTEVLTSVFVTFNGGVSSTKVKLFEKENGGCDDMAYVFIKTCKWFDNDKFGVNYKESKMKIIYSIAQQKVLHYKSGRKVRTSSFKDFI
jgi:hypothetical protein